MTPLPWHAEACAQVEARISARRLPHALLIRAPEGWGDVAFADWLALRLLEVNAGQQAAAAGAEAADAPVARSLAHPDLRWVEPDGAVIKVDEIRALNDFATGTRQSAPRKVAVIERAELLNVNAANALLKTLEEPPPDTHLLLTTSQPGRLLATIVSRCQPVVLKADAGAARRWLDERWGEDLVRERLVEYGQAPLTLDSALRADEPPLLGLLGALAVSRQPAQEAGALLELDAPRLLDRWYRCCVALCGGQLEAPWSVGVDQTALAGFVDELTRSRQQMLYSNSANARLLIERLALRWRRIYGPVTQ